MRAGHKSSTNTHTASMSFDEGVRQSAKDQVEAAALCAAAARRLQWWALRSKFGRWLMSCRSLSCYEVAKALEFARFCDSDADDSEFYEPGGACYFTDEEYDLEDEEDEWE